MPSCHPYEVRARGSERSRRVRLGTGPGSLEKVAVLGARVWPPWNCFCRLRSRCLHMHGPALANTFWRLGREVVARTRALATVLTPLSIDHRRFKQAPGARWRSR